MDSINHGHKHIINKLNSLLIKVETYYNTEDTLFQVVYMIF